LRPGFNSSNFCSNGVVACNDPSVDPTISPSGSVCGWILNTSTYNQDYWLKSFLTDGSRTVWSPSAKKRSEYYIEQDLGQVDYPTTDTAKECLTARGANSTACGGSGTCPHMALDAQFIISPVTPGQMTIYQYLGSANSPVSLTVT